MRNKQSPLETKHLVAGSIGMLCPIPGVGEAAVAYFLSPIIKKSRVFGNDELKTAVASLAIATLTRIELYKPFYLPILEYTSQLFN